MSLRILQFAPIFQSPQIRRFPSFFLKITNGKAHSLSSGGIHSSRSCYGNCLGFLQPLVVNGPSLFVLQNMRGETFSYRINIASQFNIPVSFALTLFTNFFEFIFNTSFHIRPQFFSVCHDNLKYVKLIFLVPCRFQNSLTFLSQIRRTASILVFVRNQWVSMSCHFPHLSCMSSKTLIQIFNNPFSFIFFNEKTSILISS